MGGKCGMARKWVYRRWRAAMISRSSLLLCCCISAKHSKNTRYISSYFGMAIVSPVFLYSGSKSPFSMLFCSIFADSPNLLLFFMIHYVDYLCKKIHICKKNGVPNWVLHSCRARPFSGAAGGIRTHVGLLPNWFREVEPQRHIREDNGVCR